MLKRMNQLLNVIIGSFIGVFIGHSIYIVCDFKKHPDIYAMTSAPWYTGIWLYGVFTVAIVAIALIAKWIVRKKLKP